MSTNYRGKAANASIGSAAGITSTSSSGGLIKVTTTTPHGLATGDSLYITGHGGAAGIGKEANGPWTCTFIDATNITLNGSTFVGNGGATGQVNPLAFAIGTTLPDDGDNANASSVDTPLQSTLDRVAYLGQRVGNYKFVNTYILSATAAAPDTFLVGGTTGNAVWTTNGAITSGLSGTNLVDLQPGDMVDVEFHGSISVQGTNKAVGLRLVLELADYGVAFAGTGSSFGSGSKLFTSFTGSNNVQPVTLRCNGFPSMTRGKKGAIYIQDFGVGGSQTYSLLGDACVFTNVWRPN